MSFEIRKWAGLAAAGALLAACGSGGPGTPGKGLSAGPSAGESPGLGARGESSGRGFDGSGHHPESPGHGGAPDGVGPGAPGPGGGGGADLQGICARFCERSARECGSDEGKCKAECSGELESMRGHPCEAQMRALASCIDNAPSYTCDDGELSPVGCDAEGLALLACALEHGELEDDLPGTPPSDDDDDDDWDWDWDD